MYATTVTQKGQITIPLELRNKLGFQKYGKVKLEAAADHVKVYPQEDILDLAGNHKARKGKNALKAREEMDKGYKRF